MKKYYSNIKTMYGERCSPLYFCRERQVLYRSIINKKNTMYSIRHYLCNDKVKELAKGYYPNVDLSETFIMFDESSEGSHRIYVIYGYFSVEEKSITESIYYPTLQSPTTEGDTQLDFSKMSCYCIDIVIRIPITKVQFVVTFNMLEFIYAKDDERVILWMEYQGRLLHHPIPQTSSIGIYHGALAEYFTENLLNNKCSHS